MGFCGSGYPWYTKYAVSKTAGIPSHNPKSTHIASELGSGGSSSSSDGSRCIRWLWFPAGTPAAAVRVAESDESESNRNRSAFVENQVVQNKKQ